MRKKEVVSFLKKHSTLILFGIVGFIIVDSFTLPRYSDLVFFGVTGIYGVFTSLIGTGSRVTFLITLGIVGLLFLSFVASQASNTTEKLAVWFFLFLATGIIQGWKE